MLGLEIGLNGGFGGGSNRPPAVQIGQIFTDTFSRASLGANYTTVGSPTISLSGGDMVLSGGTGNFTKYAYYNAYTTCLDSWQIVINFKAVDKTASSFGIGVGIKTASAFGNRSVVAYFNHTSGANGGKSFINAGTAAPDTFGTALATSSAQSITAGDEIRMTVTRSALNTTVLTENLTAATSTTITYSFSLTQGLSVYQNNTGWPYIVSLGGTQNIHDWTFSSTTYKNVKTVFIGDSITHGLSATSRANTWVNLIASTSYERNAGPGDYTAPVLAKINELINQNPRYAVMMLGGNDVLFGISSSTYQANYSSIVTQLKAAGITVIHCYNTPRDAIDMTSLNSWINSTYGGVDTVIDTFTPLKGVGTDLAAAYDSGDGTHPNNAGHLLIKDTVLAAAHQIV